MEEEPVFYDSIEEYHKFWKRYEIMAKSDDILTEIRAINLKLYGENGFEGDIPEIKEHLKELNGYLNNHADRIIAVETKLDERHKPSKKVVVGGVGGVAAVIALVILQLGLALNWW